MADLSLAAIAAEVSEEWAARGQALSVPPDGLQKADRDDEFWAQVELRWQAQQRDVGFN